MIASLHSIRWRLQAWHGLILLAVIVAFCVTAYQLAWDNQTRRIDRELQHLERRLLRGLFVALPEENGERRPPSPERMAAVLRGGAIELPAETSAHFQGNEPGFAYFLLHDTDGRILLQSPNVPAPQAAGPPDPDSFTDYTRTFGRHREKLGGPPGGIRSLVGRDIRPEIDDMRRLALSLAAAGLGVWALGLLGGWWLAGHAIKPIATISRTATRIAEGNLEERIDTAGTDNELDQLAGVLNQTFERLHGAFERQRRFTADASHELRTPVTILLSETQRILKRERSADEYREALQTCQDSAERMRRLIESLLLLSRFEGGPAHREHCDLAEIVTGALGQLAPLADQHRVALHRNLSPAGCSADPAAVSILASNLIANAIQHNRPGGQVWVETRAEADHVILIVRDDGPGIAIGDQPHIFDRFYRADKARTSATGHTGLGLAIAQSIVQNHGGTLAVQSNDGPGVCFTAALPVGLRGAPETRP